MTSYKENLRAITTLVFDVDGVFTDGTVIVMPDGQLLRRLSAKDSYALQYAVKKGFRIAIITGGNSMAVSDAFQRLGVRHVYLESANKLKVYNTFLEKEGITDKEVLYMGDDIPDYQVLCRAGVATCPNDASSEVKAISHYVSHKKGGKGCVRDIIEQTLRVQDKWLDHDAHDW